ncbi:GNAT family N-acetyltransferase [Ornithinibacillus scapharcae]|uniref:GNAT family N-acetyltransferase n=1 Tax=Ornithinibacillus scapharcae TaxID=1147159 RepID=UPI000225ADCA|nr:GNAT family N-acetyltransferase [Ornithinibacillus scapharcae]
MIIREFSFERDIDQVANLFHEVWNSNQGEFIERLERHGKYPGFYSFVAADGFSIVGFAYGYTSTAGQYYHERIKQALSSTEQEFWMTNCFELVELAVHPFYRRKRIGRELVTSLITQADKRTAILTTQTNNDPARTLYESLGWKIIRENFFPGESSESYIIMGLERSKNI